MSGEMEAAGAMATAGLAAGAIEGGEPGDIGDGACLNCGAKLQGSFCSQCGQVAVPHRSLLHLAEEVLHGLFHFDTKAWRTLPMVLFRPGTLTHDYVHGRRARYISPLATFLLCVFFLFFAISLAPAPVQMDDAASTTLDAQQELNDARDNLRDLQQELATVRRNLASPDADVGDRAEETALRHALTVAEAAVTRREAELARARAAEHADAETPAIRASIEASPEAPSVAVTSQPPAAPAAPETSEPDEADAPSPYPPGSLENGLYQLSQRDDIDIGGSPAFEEQVRHKLSNPPLLLYQLLDAASKFSFLLVPISLPFIAFLFLWKRGVTLYDHTVYALYGLSFASLLFVVFLASINTPGFQWLPGLLMGVALPVHTFFHLKGGYAIGWWSALWRTVFMLMFALICLIAYLAVILLVGFSE